MFLFSLFFKIILTIVIFLLENYSSIALIYFEGHSVSTVSASGIYDGALWVAPHANFPGNFFLLFIKENRPMLLEILPLLELK